jgi:glutaconate CoA-transferase, subunit A
MGDPVTAVLELGDAVSGVDSGNTVLLGNFGSQLFCVGHELIRQRKRGLHIVAGSGGILLDELLLEGVVRAATVAHCWNPIGPATARGWRRANEDGQLDLVELSLGALNSALLAAAWGVPFMPTTDLRPTGYVTADRAHGRLDVARCSFGETPVVAALVPDIAFLHVDRATVHGDGWLAQPAAEVVTAAMAASTTILVAEQVVVEAPAEWGPCDIPGVVTAAVVARPGAVRPDGAAGRYERDIAAYQAYAALRGDPGELAAWRQRVDEATPAVTSG